MPFGLGKVSRAGGPGGHAGVAGETGRPAHAVRGAVLVPDRSAAPGPGVQPWLRDVGGLRGKRRVGVAPRVVWRRVVGGLRPPIVPVAPRGSPKNAGRRRSVARLQGKECGAAWRAVSAAAPSSVRAVVRDF